RLVVFGPPRLELDGRALPPSAWRAQRAFHLLLLLALRPRGATRDELMETFWPGRQAAAGRRNFHPTLSYVRSVLPRGAAPPLLREGEIYRLNPAYAVSCDAWEWESELERARRERGASERLAALERAVALAERPPLEGVYGAWAEEVQRRWRDRQETTRIEAGRLRQQAGDAERALEHFRRAVELDEFRETTYVSLIECLMALGNRGAALAEYDRLRARLRRELAVDPLPETEEAVRRALGAAAADPVVTV
ncbi:MAG TPA: BTAD domain-containing putative transcriptional regulator, partial [Candidatus Eisenbacteria bacterium]|nr:BTAD domain-containing putative transcriptional regulator [Candidatus Eisenbacteria bacterium]